MLTHGTFTVSYIRNGNVVTVFTEILNAAGEGTTLVQYWQADPDDPEAGSVAASTDWSQAALQPIIHIKIRSSANYPVTVKDVTWAYDGSPLYFAGINDSTWTAESTGKPFAVRIVNGEYCLRITDNLIDSGFMGNKILSYDVTYSSLGMTDTVPGTCSVWLIQGSKGAVTMFLTANRTEISGERGSATYSAQLAANPYMGAEPISVHKGNVDEDYYYIVWRDADGIIDDQYITSTTRGCEVDRDLIQGEEVIQATLMEHKAGTSASADKELAWAQKSIHDIADEYQIFARPQNGGGNWVGPEHNATYHLELQKNNRAYSPTGGIAWSWEVFNELGEITYNGGNSYIVTIIEAYCRFVFRNAQQVVVDEGYGDATVQATAQWTE